MAVLVNMQSAPFTKGPRAFPVTVPAGIRTLKVTLDRDPSWLDGPVASASIAWSDGSGCAVTLTGGTQFDDPPVPGDPPVVRIKNDFTVTKPPGLTRGTVSLDLAQDVTTALKVESA